MKISVIGTRGFPKVEGGVEKHCELLYPLLRKDIDVTVYRRKPYVNSIDSYENISFIDFPSTKIKGVEAVIHSYLATIDVIKKKPDVVHIHNIGPALFCSKLKRKGIPIILTYHSPNYEHAKWGTFAKKLLFFSEKTAIKNADRIIFVNRFQMEKYPEWVRRKSVYVPNGIAKPAFASNQEYLRELGIEPGKYILSVGRITQEKGFDTLIKAYKRANSSRYKLVIAGGVEFENSYMKELKELSNNNVIFTGYVFGDNLAQLYVNAALYVLASNNEGFPLVLLESMSYGLDVLVSDIPATHLVDLDEDDYFEKGNYKALSKKITEKLKAPKKRKYDLREYDWNKIANTMSDVIHEVAGK